MHSSRGWARRGVARGSSGRTEDAVRLRGAGAPPAPADAFATRRMPPGVRVRVCLARGRSATYHCAVGGPTTRIEQSLAPVDACPVCGSPRAAPFDSARDTLADEINRYLPPGVAPLEQVTNNRRRCGGCGLVYLDPRLDSRSLSRLYELWYGYAYRRIFQDDRHIAERRREFERHHLRTLDRAAPEAGTLLDVGCGSGIFLAVAARSGWRGVGVEFDPATAASGRLAYGVDIRCGTLAQTIADDERFDAITLFDYLEHSAVPGEDLSLLAARLAPGGVMLVRVPNQGGWQARWMGARWVNVISNHLSYFEPQVLAGALRKRGLQIVSVRAGNYRSEWQIVRGHWHWLGQRLGATVGAPGGTSPADGATLRPSAAPGALSRYLNSVFVEQIDHVGGWFGRGNNLMVVARRP